MVSEKVSSGDLKVSPRGNKEEHKEEEPIRKKDGNFISPSLEELTSYCLERKNGINPQGFIDFYSSKGWMIGKNKMRDWKAAVRTWESRTPPKISSLITNDKYKGL